MDFHGASVNMAGSHSTATEQPRPTNAHLSATSFESNLQAAQLDSSSGVLGTSALDVPFHDPETSDTSEDSTPDEQLMWLGVTLPLLTELRPDDTAADTPGDSASLVSNDTKSMTRADAPSLFELGLNPVGVSREGLSADPESVSINPATVDLPTLEPGLRFTPETVRPANDSPFSTIDEALLSDSFLDDGRFPMDDPTRTPPSVDEKLESFDAPAAGAENTVTVEHLTGFSSVQPHEVHANNPHAATPSSPSLRSIPVNSRSELSEVVRQVRTLVTQHETQSIVHLELAVWGRLTLELVDAPDGLRANISAEDPAVLRFLERNVQLLESEARLQGVGQMSFSVGADVSGGLGRGDQRQSETEESLRQNIAWNTTPQSIPRSRRELDMNA